MQNLQPHNIEAEQSVLGSILLDNEVVSYIEGKLQPDDFFKESHRTIYKTMLEVWQQNEFVDLVTLTEALRVAGVLERVGNVPYLIGLADGVPTAAYAEQYAHIVHSKAMLREFVKQQSRLIQVALDSQNLEHVMSDAEQTVFDMSRKLRGEDTWHDGAALAHSVFSGIDETLARPVGSLPGLSTGLRDLDKAMGGFEPKQLYVLGARPSMGKTAMAIKNALSVARYGSVLFFSLEMSAQKIAGRMMSQLGTVRSDKIRYAHELSSQDEEKLVKAGEMLTNLGIHVDDSAELDIGTLVSKATKRALELGDVKLIVIDYLQMMDVADTGNRAREIGKVTRRLKALAKTLDCAVLVLSQLSRAVEARPNKRPVLSDLRESGEIEQDADVVLFLYRDEYYNPQTTDKAGIAEAIFGKQRNGEVGTVELQFSGAFTRFSDLIQV